MTHRHIPRRTVPFACLALALALLTAPTAQAKPYGDWQGAVSLTAVNSAATEGCPIEAPDGLSLFIMSTRGAGGDQDIWVATRDDVDDEFGAPEELPSPVNSGANDFCPTPLRGKGLLFVSTRGGVDAYGTVACGMGDIYFTRLSPASGEWSPARNLGCATNGGPNTTGMEYGPSVIETDAGRQLYYSSGPAVGAGGQDIFVSQQGANGSFGVGSLVASLSSGADDLMPNVRKDGLEVVLASSRPGGAGLTDIWSSTRSSVWGAWSTPVNVAVVNTTGAESRPSLSWKGDRLYFGRSGDIFVSSR